MALQRWLAFAALSKASAEECDAYCGAHGCGWTQDWSCPWEARDGRKGRANNKDLGYSCCCEKRKWDSMPCGGDYHGGHDCSYTSNKVKHYSPLDITADGPMYIGKAPLPAKLQGVFWLVDDGGDALISLGAPPGSDGSGRCANGKLVQKEADKFCSSISTVRPGQWSYQQVTKPGLSGGKFPTVADKFYDSCAIEWKWCFNSEDDPTIFKADPVQHRSACVNVMAMGTTHGKYEGEKWGGHYWRVTTLGLGVVPLPDWLLGNFDMIQVMDGNGQKIQPAWDKFAAANPAGIVMYDDFGVPQLGDESSNSTVVV